MSDIATSTDFLLQRAREHDSPNRRVKIGFQTPLANTLWDYQLEVEHLDHLIVESSQRIADNAEQATKGLIPR